MPSLLCREGKQGILSKSITIKCCKETKITAPPNEYCNIPLSLHAKISVASKNAHFVGMYFEESMCDIMILIKQFYILIIWSFFQPFEFMKIILEHSSKITSFYAQLWCT